MEKHDQIAQNITAILNNKSLSDKEIEHLQKFLDSFDNSEDIETWLQNNWNNATTGGGSRLSFYDLRKKISREPTTNAKPVLRLPAFMHYVAAAVIVTVFLAASFYLAERNMAHEKNIAKQKTTIKQEKKIVRNVVFSNGKEKFTLSGAKTIIKGAGLKAIGNDDALTVKAEKDITESTPKSVWSSLFVPLTKDYYVELADGTKVWMNAGSKLEFPNFFEGPERLVKLDGEAYFEVVSNPQKPFFVQTPNSTVKVTGTHFNVCSYDDEPDDKITLAEGKVEVIIDEKNYKLQPNQQVVFTKQDRKIIKHTVEADLFTSWRKGEFVFKEISLLDLSYRLSKWYAVDFTFNDKELKDLKFTGAVYKTRSLEYFLRVIEKTTEVKFSIDRSNITVTKT